MITVQEATAMIMAHRIPLSVESVDLLDSLGRVLAEDVFADRDLPPFDRVTMDGIAIAYSGLTDGNRSFILQGVQQAGQPALSLQSPRHAIEIMTGAVLPSGADTVVRYEDLVISDGTVALGDVLVERGQSIHPQGQDIKKADVIIGKGTRISPAEIASMASVGKTRVNVYQLPKAALVSTGDELVDINATPEPHQIRRSNTYALQAAMLAMQWEATQFHLPDDEKLLLSALQTILSDHDVVILSGGVSKGKFDYIPQTLQLLGVERKFHEVKQRPGKPLWFGVSTSGKVVFALPGNPVSTFMCYHRYIRPWMLQSLYQPVQTPMVILGTDFTFKPDLTYFLQAKLENESGTTVAYPVAGGGSGDFVNLRNVDGFLELPAEKSVFKAGEVFPFYGFRG